MGSSCSSSGGRVEQLPHERRPERDELYGVHPQQVASHSRDNGESTVQEPYAENTEASGTPPPSYSRAIEETIPKQVLPTPTENEETPPPSYFTATQQETQGKLQGPQYLAELKVSPLTDIDNNGSNTELKQTTEDSSGEQGTASSTQPRPPRFSDLYGIQGRNESFSSDVLQTGSINNLGDSTKSSQSGSTDSAELLDDMKQKADELKQTADELSMKIKRYKTKWRAKSEKKK